MASRLRAKDIALQNGVSASLSTDGGANDRSFIRQDVSLALRPSRRSTRGDAEAPTWWSDHDIIPADVTAAFWCAEALIWRAVFGQKTALARAAATY
jgi:hypothetical protein